MSEQLNRIEAKIDRLLERTKLPVNSNKITMDDIQRIYGISRHHFKKIEHLCHNYGGPGKTAKKLYRRSEVERAIKHLN